MANDLLDLEMLVPLMGGAADIALPTENLLALWYAGNGAVDHASISGSDGNPVTAWADISPSGGYDVSQAVEAARPVYHRSVAALNGRGAVEFDGDDYLERTIAAGIAANLDEYTILVVGITSSDDCFYSEGRSTSSTPRIAVFLSSSTGFFDHRDNANVRAFSTGGGDITGVKRLIVAHRIAAASFALRVDGVEIGTSTVEPTTTTINRLALGALVATTVSTFLTGHLAVCAVYGANNVATIEPIAADFYEIALP